MIGDDASAGSQWGFQTDRCPAGYVAVVGTVPAPEPRIPAADGV